MLSSGQTLKLRLDEYEYWDKNCHNCGCFSLKTQLLNSYFPVSFEEMDDFVFDSEFHSLGK